ncbi:MAG: radical SAM protein [Candidatus Saelkia tenebricola]|nr:radical SAM protein [Candidatus Saelkia tenebricola]
MLNIALISLYGVENNGIRSISSFLKQNGFNVYLIFFKRWLNNDMHYPSEKEKRHLVSLCKELEIDLVGISFTSPFLKIAQDLTMQMKSSLDIKIAWGGIHATVEPRESLEYCDFICRGEGEHVMLDLARALAGRWTLEGIKNLCYKKDDKVIFEDLRPLIQDLDILPPQDYGGVNKFFIDKDLKNIDPLVSAKELRVFASRGCPFNCSYCYNSIYRALYQNQRYYRIGSVEKVLSEIEVGLSRFKKIKKIKFDDDTFIFPAYWIDEFCKKYRQRVKLPFEILFNAQCLDKSNLKKLKCAGLKRIQIGIQTGSVQESEQVYNRKLEVDVIKKFAQEAKKINLDVVYDLIFDNPLSTPENKKELITLLLDLPRPFSLFLYSLTVFPGTELSKIFLEKKIITPDDIEGRANKSFYQFRLGFSYPRSEDELFAVAIVSLISKSFIPKNVIRLLARSVFLKKHLFLIKLIAQASNFIKLFHVGLKMIMQGVLSVWKFKEYGSPKRLLIQ